MTRPRKLDTAEAADLLRIRPQTLRRALCLQGHYFGMRPVKLPNGRLLWDAADLDRLTAGEGA
ncbi:MAG: DNA-binding protein [Thauera sp.]|nr:DNA-binding protein [Thauera sp.]MBX3683726.1 DNA-binding protein [Thauera sp.]